MDYFHLYFLCFIWYTYVQATVEESDVPCFETFCNCSRKHCTAKCKLLGFIPRLPSYVVKLELENNFLSHINMDTFRNVSKNNLTSLIFRNNSIEDFTVDSFQELIYLGNLEISYERKLNVSSLKMSFRSLNKTLFDTMRFRNNAWTMLPIDFFSNLRNYTMNKLYINENTFMNFNCSLLSHFSTIHKLNVGRNEILFLYARGLHSVTNLTLSANNIFEIPNFCANEAGESLVPKLSRLDLTDNAIRKLLTTSFNCLDNLKHLILDKNRLTVLENDIFSRLSNLKILWINRMCHLSIVKPRAFRSPSMTELMFGYNRCHFKTELFQHVPSLKKLDLTNHYISSSPNILWKLLYPLSNLTVLILQASRIKILPDRLFQQMPFLQTLNLKGNRIVTWSRDVFENLTSLRHLYLDGNYIRVINESSFPIQLLRSLNILDISHNDFWCTCGQRWFVEYLRSSNISKIMTNWPKYYSCVYPDDKKGLLLKDYKPTDAECSTWSPIFTIVIVTVASIFIVTCVLVIMFSCNTNIRNLIYLIRVKKWKRKGYIRFNSSESCEYDAFVIYCDSDRQWVHLELLKRLEEIGLKVCVHQRDFEIGESITDNITKYVGKSWKIIVVMSNNFTKSEWCQWELDLVQERRRRHGKDALILIMHSQIDSSHMTNSIKSLLDTTPHLQYQKGLGEDLFWSAIMKAVRKPLKHPPVSIL
ncbi:toll-like receptor 13 [Mytilus californianus]|uniref:toll-like receptor 13 n=1 Tax=Mytilus californianus TaxID=6549 RepID=UPI002246AF06|nr:toll-like receptor 13 [Mytilus californianus]